MRKPPPKRYCESCGNEYRSWARVVTCCPECRGALLEQARAVREARRQERLDSLAPYQTPEQW